MDHIKSCGIMIVITVLALLWWFRDPFKPYDTMPFSIEPYVAYDSILATYGFKEDSHIKPFYRNYLITGFADTLNCERKIDSLLPSLIDTFYDYKKGCTIWFFKKSNKCNNAYTRWDREWTENFAETECLFVKYTISVNKENRDIVSIIKEKSWKNNFGNFIYHIVWNGNYPYKVLEKETLAAIPLTERNPSMEKLLDTIVSRVKATGKFKKEKATKETWRYFVE
jgi:hypothetical protein